MFKLKKIVFGKFFIYFLAFGIEQNKKMSEINVLKHLQLFHYAKILTRKENKGKNRTNLMNTAYKTVENEPYFADFLISI